MEGEKIGLVIHCLIECHALPFYCAHASLTRRLYLGDHVQNPTMQVYATVGRAIECSGYCARIKIQKKCLA